MPIQTLIDLLADLDPDGSPETMQNQIVVLTIVLRETLLKVAAINKTLGL